MARNEQPREDLLAEATALVERAELLVEGFAEPVVVGFRKNGAASVFLGQDPVYQFNAASELRRVFHAGRMFKAEAGRLVLLERNRRETAIELATSELTFDEAKLLLSELAEQMQRVKQQLAAGRFQLVGQVPANVDVVARIAGWLEMLPAEVVIAQRPHVG